MQMQSQSSGSAMRAVTSASVGALPPGLADALRELAQRRGFSLEAAQVLWRAVTLGRGSMAQFSHAEFGGSGQWMRGGMVMVGDMFNRSLAARVGALADDMAQLWVEHPEFAAGAEVAAGTGAGEWWPADLHSPATSGAQNGVRYAWFPIQRRLAIEREGAVELYDTQDHLIGGVSQQQGGASTLSFSSQHGPVDLETLRRVTDTGASTQAPEALPASQAARTAAGAGRPVGASPTAAAGRPFAGLAAAPHEVLDTIERLADLHKRGVLTDDEFKTKKAELLGRL
jgi:hypothetical protein